MYVWDFEIRKIGFQRILLWEINEENFRLWSVDVSEIIDCSAIFETFKPINFNNYNTLPISVIRASTMDALVEAPMRALVVATSACPIFLQW